MNKLFLFLTTLIALYGSPGFASAELDKNTIRKLNKSSTRVWVEIPANRQKYYGMQKVLISPEETEVGKDLAHAILASCISTNQHWFGSIACMVADMLQKEMPNLGDLNSPQFQYVSKTILLDIRNRLHNEYGIDLSYEEVPHGTCFGDLAPGVHPKPRITNAVVGAPIADINTYYGAAIKQVPHCNIYHSEKLNLDVYALYDDNSWCQGLIFFEPDGKPLSPAQIEALDEVNAPQGVKAEWQEIPQQNGTVIRHAEDSVINITITATSRGYATLPGLKLMQEVTDAGKGKKQ